MKHQIVFDLTILYPDNILWYAVAHSGTTTQIVEQVRKQEWVLHDILTTQVTICRLQDTWNTFLNYPYVYLAKCHLHFYSPLLLSYNN